MDTFLATLFMIVCILLIIVVLLQRGRGSGLGGAFGGGGHSAFGTRTGDVFTWVTIVLVAVFILLAVVATLRFRSLHLEQVPKCVFYPPSKRIEKRTPLTIKCPHAKAKVYYEIGRIDEQKNNPLPNPTPRLSRPYDAAIPIEPGTLVKARAFHSGWKPSVVTEAQYPDASKVPAAPSTEPAAATAPPR